MGRGGSGLGVVDHEGLLRIVARGECLVRDREIADQGVVVSLGGGLFAQGGTGETIYIDEVRIGEGEWVGPAAGEQHSGQAHGGLTITGAATGHKIGHGQAHGSLTLSGSTRRHVAEVPALTGTARPAGRLAATATRR